MTYALGKLLLNRVEGGCNPTLAISVLMALQDV